MATCWLRVLFEAHTRSCNLPVEYMLHMYDALEDLDLRMCAVNIVLATQEYTVSEIVF